MPRKIENTTKGIIFIDKTHKAEVMEEKLTAKVQDVKVTYPKELGVEHPFNFEDMEKVYKKAGFVYGAVNRYVHSIIGEAQIKVKSEEGDGKQVENAQKILNDFMKEANVKAVLREWLVEGFTKGNGFLEFDIETKKLEVINANDVYIKRDENGQVEAYNQYLAKSNLAKREVVPLPFDKIIHVPINKIAGAAYGIGILSPNERVIQNIILNEQDLHKLISRKAGAPIHFKVGQPGEAVNNSVIGQIQADLQYMTNRTEWVTDGNVDIKTVDFGNIGGNLTSTLEHDLLMWSFGTLIPESLMGSGNIPEGLALAHTQDWNRLISAYQDIIEQLLEQKLFKAILLKNNIDLEVDFIWNLPSETEINARVTMLLALINGMSVSPNLKRYAELDIARLLNFEGADKILRQPEEGLDDQKEAEAEAAMSQPEVPGAKRLTKVKQIAESEDEMNLNVKEFVDLKEIAGFNYSDYLTKILQTLNKDPFNDLKAISEKQIEMGLLSESDVDKLRVILKNGFRENKSMKEIEKDIKDKLDLKDRLDENMNLIMGKESRPNIIARSETVRAANEGLVSLYKDNGIDKVRWLASISPRTCPLCLDLNGQVFNITELQVGVSQPPLHPNCRCTLLSIQE